MTADLHAAPSEDQLVFYETTRRFIDTHCPLTLVRQLADAGETVDPKYRRQAAELGWFALLVPEAFGGGSISGNGLVDASLVAAARGASLQPTGFVGMNVVAGTLARCEASEAHRDLIEALIEGRRVAAWAAMGPRGEPEPGSGVSATREGGHFRLSGTKSLVEDAGAADVLLVTAELDGALAQLLVPIDAPGVEVSRMDALDLTRALYRVRLDDVVVDAAAAVGAPGECEALVAWQLGVACVLSAAETVGAMSSDFEAALAYAKDRVAFGRPVGSFQAIKHLLADTSLALEMSKAVVAGAARSVGGDEEDAGELASVAKAFVAERGVTLGQSCFQVFGGIGYTWEHDHHLFMRRISGDAALHGGADWHRERICRLAGI